MGRTVPLRTSSAVAEAYDQAGAAYSAYADGDPAQFFDFSGPHARADHCVRSYIATKPAKRRILGTTFAADLRDPLPEPDGLVDISLCLYSVLNHLPLPALPKSSADLARVTSEYFITTLRSIGSTPSAMVGSVRRARHDAARRLGLAHLLALGAHQHGQAGPLAYGHQPETGRLIGKHKGESRHGD